VAGSTCGFAGPGFRSHSRRRRDLPGFTGQLAGSIAAILAPHNEIYGLARYTRPGSREAVEAAHRRGPRAVPRVIKDEVADCPGCG